jgi:hypothetical protein
LMNLLHNSASSSFLSKALPLINIYTHTPFHICL